MMTFPGYDESLLTARGSTGTVWRARQPDLDRLVAIKELSPALVASPGFRERFRAEARILAGLADPHVVRLYDYVETADRAYLVQEWVDGAPLADVLSRHGRLSAEQALGVLRGALLGLAHAHERGLVHRDISPANILLDAAGTSKLVDFGLAVPTGVADPAGVPVPVARSVVGTPAFASPEAVTGAPVTARSDVYSAAALLFLLLSGRLPYAGDAAQVVRMHATAEAPRLAEAGPELADLIARAMAKDPARRPADAAAFLAEFEVAAVQRYGVGWLARSSIAGLVTGSGAIVGAGALGGGAVGGAPVVASAATGATASAVGAAAARVGGRAFGLPQLAAVVAGVVAVAAAGTAFALTRSDGDGPTGGEASSRTSVPTAGNTSRSEAESTATTTATPTTTAAPTTTVPPVPAVAGTYELTLTYTGAEGVTADDFAVGEVATFTWTVASTCPSGPCDFQVTSSSGRTYTYAYDGSAWQRADVVSDECTFEGTGTPTGVTITLDVLGTLRADPPLDPGTGVPLSTLSGSGSDSTTSDCDGNPSTYTYDLLMTRAGD